METTSLEEAFWQRASSSNISLRKEAIRFATKVENQEPNLLEIKIGGGSGDSRKRIYMGRGLKTR